MVRAIWSGAISFGLVNIPIQVVSAARDQTIRFNLLHKADGARIKFKRVCSKDGEEVTQEDIVRGHEIARDQYVTVTDEEMDGLDPKASRTIDIMDFVEAASIDPVYFETPYYVIPGKNAGKAYALLLEAMKKTKKVAVARVVMRGTEYLMGLRARSDVIVMTTMRFDDEIIPASAALADKEPVAEGLQKKEIEMAEQLIKALATDFDAGKYHNQHRKKVDKLIEKKAAGQEIVTAPTVEAKATKGADLAAMLQRSIEEARKKIAADTD